MTYKFNNFKTELINPKIDSLSWMDSFGGQSMPVSAILKTPDGSKFGVDLGVFDYSAKGTYGDEDVMEWAVNELEKYKA